MRLICIGDSWTAGHGVEEEIEFKEIANPHNGGGLITKLRHANGWPRWLANKFDCPYALFAECGGNNDWMGNDVETIVNSGLLKDTDIIIVMFSYPYRDQVGPIRNYERMENLLKNHKHFYINSFYPTFKNEENFDINTLPDYFIEPASSVSDMLREYEIANDVSVWEYNSRSVYNDEHNFYVGDYHPNLLGYKLIANHIYDLIKNKI